MEGSNNYTKSLTNQLNNILNKINDLENKQKEQYDTIINKINDLENKQKDENDLLSNEINDLKKVIQQRQNKKRDNDDNRLVQGYDSCHNQSISNDKNKDTEPQQKKNIINKSTTTSSSKKVKYTNSSSSSSGNSDEDDTSFKYDRLSHSMLYNKKNLPVPIRDYLVEKMLSMKKTATTLIKFKEIQNDDISETTLKEHQKYIVGFINDVSQDISQKLNQYKDIIEIEIVYQKYIDENKTSYLLDLLDFIKENNMNEINQTDVKKYLFLKQCNNKISIKNSKSSTFKVALDSKKKNLDNYFPGSKKDYSHFNNWFENFESTTLFAQGIFSFSVDKELTRDEIKELQIYFAFYNKRKTNTSSNYNKKNLKWLANLIENTSDDEKEIEQQ